MKTEKFQLRGNNSVCAGEFQLLRDRAPAQLRGKIGGNMFSLKDIISFSLVTRNFYCWIKRGPNEDGTAYIGGSRHVPFFRHALYIFTD
jgi:hypothetical protein